MSTTPWTIRDLRRRWKPAKERLQAARADDPTAIRVHRCCSWLARVESMDRGILDDSALIMRWISLNSLYGRWNAESREPEGDRQMLGEFTSRIIEIDQSGHIRGVLDEHQPLAMTILNDEYLAKFYWEDPTAERAHRSKKAVTEARKAYKEHRYAGVLHRVLDRIYLLRCQLVHGAATAGSSLNRTALRRCNTMLEHLIPAIVLVVIDHGEREDWGPLCYPPRAA